MKKFFSFVAAAAVAATSFTALASFADNKSAYTSEYVNTFGVPTKDYVTIDLDMTSKKSSSLKYADHPTQNKALSFTYRSSSNTFDSMATLDMSGVAAEWDAYLDTVAGSDETLRSYAIAHTTLTGEYKLVITADEGISNAAVEDISTVAASFTWPDIDGTVGGAAVNADTYFDLDSAVYDAASNTLTITMKIDSPASVISPYFDAVNAASNKSEYAFKFAVAGSTVSTDTNGVYYKVAGDMSGYVTINAQGLTSTDQSTVYFGSNDGYTPTDTAYTNVSTTDVEYLYVTTSGGGGGGGSVAAPTVRPTDIAVETPTPTAEPGSATATPAPTPVANPQTGGTANGAKLEYDKHYAYIIGYPIEGDAELAEVRPLANITRAEVATIFFRMLTDESRAEFWTKDNSFSDVELEAWYNNAISTAANAGIVNGYEDGTFRPDGYITRAEFAAIAARFSSIAYEGDDKFSDISGHWAEQSINDAAETGWINGYDDGTFKPNAYITRAEAITLINRILYRLVLDDGLLDDMLIWSDNPEGTWYYAAMQEATNSHDYDREDIGYYETWTEIVEPRDWEALEKTYSEVTDAGSEESVFSTAR